MNNWFLQYVEKDYNRNSLTNMYVGAIENILDNENEYSSKEQVKMLNELRKNYREALKLVESKS